MSSESKDTFGIGKGFPQRTAEAQQAGIFNEGIGGLSSSDSLADRFFEVDEGRHRGSVAGTGLNGNGKWLGWLRESGHCSLGED